MLVIFASMCVRSCAPVCLMCLFVATSSALLRGSHIKVLSSLLGVSSSSVFSFWAGRCFMGTAHIFIIYFHLYGSRLSLFCEIVFISQGIE
ncbi:hypothetical protein B0H67DRAFT_571200 [Lasiosphaeris hirsuta]|uniref:Uncharacterized protein n=1 Tax=Lasiosphaeris hirsuta TaxID=260670 RepID=A0AA40B186_9PEZI|nr:hypothetical protein B0H67DRAFT_571200 [Lasiosphaeris hirsuta]